MGTDLPQPGVYVPGERSASDVSWESTGSFCAAFINIAHGKGHMTAVGTEHEEVTQSDKVMFNRGAVRCPPVVPP